MLSKTKRIHPTSEDCRVSATIVPKKKSPLEIEGLFVVYKYRN